MFTDIVEFELEALRRGLHIEGPVETTPPICAYARFTNMLARGHLEGACQSIVCMDGVHLWIAYRDTRNLDKQFARIILFNAIITTLIARLFEQSDEPGGPPRTKEAPQAMSEDDLEAYLEQRIIWLFGWSAIRYGPL